MRRVRFPSSALAFTLLIVCSLGGCASYRTPGGPADFRALGITEDHQRALTDGDIAARLHRKPAASFPASIAAIRVQAAGYCNYSVSGHTRGDYSVVTVRDVETEEQFQRIASLPMVAGVAPINRLILPRSISVERDLRGVAADVHADIVLLYTFETVFGSETLVPALGFITLGLFPNEQARVTSTASAALIDTRTGYIYGVAESTSKTDQLHNAWTSRDAIDQSRRRAETRAFEGLVDQLTQTWTQVAAAYGPSRGTPTETGSATVTSGLGSPMP